MSDTEKTPTLEERMSWVKSYPGQKKLFDAWLATERDAWENGSTMRIDDAMASKMWCAWLNSYRLNDSELAEQLREADVMRDSLAVELKAMRERAETAEKLQAAVAVTNDGLRLQVGDLEAQRDQLVEALHGAMVDDLLPLHSAEWVAKARAALTAAGVA